MTYRARNAARRVHNPPAWLVRERKRAELRAAFVAKYGREPSQFESMSSILKLYYGDGQVPKSIYERSSFWFLGVATAWEYTDHVESFFSKLGIPVKSLTARADFEAARYWAARKLGPDPYSYVRRRHARQPYTF